jgi:hypothetical protein
MHGGQPIFVGAIFIGARVNCDVDGMRKTAMNQKTPDQ